MTAAPKNNHSKAVFRRDEKTRDVRQQNIIAAKAVADIIRTSLGPKGMDKMIEDTRGGVIITNDGATILKQLAVTHPTARMLVELSKSQDIEAGDGTTSVVIIAGALLDACQYLLDKGIHPQAIAQSFAEAADLSETILKDLAVPVDLSNRESLLNAATTALNSKIVSHSSHLLAPMAVDAVLRIVPDIKTAADVDFSNIKVAKMLGGTVEDSAIVDGLVFTNQKVSKRAAGPTMIENAKIGLIQFCLSPPKTDMENNITIKDYQAMDRLMREERLLVAKMVKQIAATGCNVLMIQKSILRDAVTDLSLDFLAKSKILVIRDIDRDDIEFISNTTGCQPVASLDEFTADKLGAAATVFDEMLDDGGHIVRVQGVKSVKHTASVFLQASNTLMLDELERSFHDALCVVRCLVKKRFLIPGGGAPEIELAHQLNLWSKKQSGVKQFCYKAYASAMELIPYTLAENSGLNPIEIVTEMRNRHANGAKHTGINVRKGTVTDMSEEHVIQPLLVTTSAVKLATETVVMILKIDDTVLCR